MKNTIVKLLNQFLKFNTYNWNKNKQDYYNFCLFIEILFIEMGFSTEIIETNSGPIFFAESKYISLGKHIHFNGHYDVISPNIGQKINNNSENRFYGRGSSDMKGGIISIILALKNYNKHKDCNSISISLSPDEETGGQVGSIGVIKRLKSSDIKPDLIIIADSSFPNIVVGHRGAIWMNIISEMSIKSRFAIQKGGSSSFIFAALIAAELENKIRDLGYDCYSAGKCLSDCHAPNGIQTSFSYSLDVRFDYPEKSLIVENRIKDIFHCLSKKKRIEKKLRIEKHLSVEACPKKEIEHDIFSLIKNEIFNVKQISSKGFYDLRYFRDNFDCNSFVLGPGLPELAHSANEHIFFDNIIKCTEIYQSIIRNY